MPKPLWSVSLGACALVLSAVGCSTTTGSQGGGASSVSDDRLTVMAAFYPLQFAAEQVGGDQVAVEGVTPPGTEPHDVELSPQQIAELGEADLVLYIKGFQPAVDEAVAQVASDKAVDVSEGITMLDNSADTGVDPHIWLDPANMVSVADTISARLGEVSPEGKSAFTANAVDLGARLTELDRQWADRTETCANRDLVVSHEAFGYLAARYDFTQLGISGLSPGAEPSPAQVAEVTDFVRRNKVRTIYFETLVDPKVAETVAGETGAVTAVLDPLESLPEGSRETYLTIMAKNLDTVVAGQPCP